MLSANAQSPDDVLAENALVKLTRGDYEADLQRIPADSREGFATDPKRLTQFLNNLLLAKTLAAEARNSKIDRDPTVVRRIGLEADRLLAALQIQAIEEAAGRDFDRRSPQLVNRAREMYLVDQKKYVRQEQVSTSQIVFKTATRDPNAALALARDARAKLLAGADFATLASQLSEDPATKFNSGRLGWQSAGDMDPAVGKAAFELKNPGDLSEPVQARDGYRIIRLEGRRAPAPLSFEEVKDQILGEMRKRYVDDQREAQQPVATVVASRWITLLFLHAGGGGAKLGATVKEDQSWPWANGAGKIRSRCGSATRTCRVHRGTRSIRRSTGC